MDNMSPRLIYLDVCVLCRPFDDQSLIRTRLETEAVNLIISKVKENHYKIISSPVHTKEIESIRDDIERYHLTTLLGKYGKFYDVDFNKVERRAEELTGFGFGIADAAHVAFAEEFKAEFISCDTRLINKCSKFIKKIWCGNPLNFCEKENLK